jgi:hypothetical protein
MESYWKQKLRMENYMEDIMTKSVDTDTPVDTTIASATLTKRLEELQKDHERMTQEMEKLETHKQQGAQTLLVLSGAIQVLEELTAGRATVTE